MNKPVFQERISQKTYFLSLISGDVTLVYLVYWKLKKRKEVKQHLVLVSPGIKLICRELVHFSPRTRPPLKLRFDHRIRIVFAEHTTKALLVTGTHSEGAVDQIVAHSLERGQPKASVVALGVIVVRLLYCVEVSVLAGVGANTGCVLPVAPVAAGVVVDELRFEVFGAVPPVLKGDNENCLLFFIYYSINQIDMCRIQRCSVTSN